MSKVRKSADITRSHRRTNVDDDGQTQLEIEMAASGRRDIVPREGLVGAHTERRAPSRDEDRDAEPTGLGSDVGPTKRAEARERERHRLEREIGRTPAGEEGLIHDRRAPTARREDLAEAARRADEHVTAPGFGQGPPGRG
jgi:hypothetical protein